MNPEIIKTTSVVEKKFTYPNGCYILYTLKDDELYSYSMMKGIYHYNYYLKDLLIQNVYQHQMLIVMLKM